MNTTDPAVITFANDAFYLAFNARDLRQMDELWARESPCVCIHPGWRPLLDRADIMQSWRRIFSGQADGVQILCHGPRVLTQGELFSVICYEQLPGGWLAATNNFVLEGGVAKMVHHQGSQCVEPPTFEPAGRTLQ